jgi:hypothetical protein
MFFPFNNAGALTADRLRWVMSKSSAGSHAFTVLAGVYSYVNSTQITLLGSSQNVYSATDTGSVSGVRIFEAALPTAVTTLDPGQYILGVAFSATATASMNYYLMGAAVGNAAAQTAVMPGSNAYSTATSYQPMPFWGKYTATSNVLPNSAGKNQISANAGSEIPMYFTIAR